MTFRWTEREAILPPGYLYTCFIEEQDDHQGSWRDIATPVFHTHDTAAANALREARQAINKGLAETCVGLAVGTVADLR